MYLKSIEIQGFKSFANKIVFEFHDGITGIVGPNGSGKSNVADAVRWVLGEQSAKQLRGSRMEDVIFSGTQARKPLGFAYVAITLDNSDHKLPISYDQVTVARRVYRSGESEYLINGANCRLRDVQEMFLDTGIGKEGYSIIGQGQIDKILSGKPEERRELFDEAAGIVKFKKRKAAAEKNLAEEEANLTRITDILSEIEKQIGPLKRQSETAKEYLRLRDSLKGKEVSQFLAEYDRSRTAKQELDDKSAIVSADLEATRQEYNNTREEYERLERELERYNAEIEALREKSTQMSLTAEKTAGQIELLKEQISSAEQKAAQYEERLLVLQKEIAEKEAGCRAQIAEKQAVDEKLDALDEEQILAAEQLEEIREEIREATESIEQRNSDIFRILNENGTIKTNMQRYRTILEQNQIKKSQLSQKLLENKSEEAECLERVTKEKEKLRSLSHQILTQTKENEAMSRSMNGIQEEIDTLTKELNEKQKRYLSEVSRLESLQNIAERYEGYGGSIRRVMERKKDCPGILGVVADIIQVDKAYEVAVETALGGQIQNIVTDTEETAKALIEYLKRNRYGRATFLPLTSIADRSQKNQEVLAERGVIGTADSLVRIEERFRTLAGFLLGRIYVVDTIDNALSIARKYRYTLRIVTLEGEQLNPGGSLSGGAYKNSSSLLGRRREIEELEDTTKKLEGETKQLSEQKEAKKAEKAALRETLEERRSGLQKLYIEQNTARMTLQREQTAYDSCKGSYQEYADEIRLIDTQNADLNAGCDKLKEDLEENKTAQKLAEDEIAAMNALVRQKQAQEQEASHLLEEKKLAVQSLDQKNSYIMENISRIKGELEKLSEEREEREAGLREARESLKERMAQRKEEETKREQALRDCDGCGGEAEKLIAGREELNRSHKNFFAKREELSQKESALDKELFRLNGQREKLEEQISAMMDHMWQEYELTVSSALELSVERAENPAAVKKEIAALRAQIKELGDVNVNAIEDYRSMNERYEFLTGQKNDLLEAEETLKGIISELDEEMRKQFSEKFADIQKQFDIVFKALFGGGHGSLELMEDQDLLEAGIRIIAQPPGKKLQNMMQLSGGEKALTAIALLFAIQNLKPSPFCLLDEIEAALDESNVKRYADYLHKLTKDTQFIVITHRRGTMAAADILYGITMQEKGVSTLVSVNLIDDQLEK